MVGLCTIISTCVVQWSEFHSQIDKDPFIIRDNSPLDTLLQEYHDMHVDGLSGILKPTKDSQGNGYGQKCVIMLNSMF